MPSGNPFATRHVRPGALSYRFAPGENVAKLVDRLAQDGWRGEIVGPHGSGKSTLLVALSREIEARGRRAHLVTLHDGERCLPLDHRQRAALDKHSVLIVDGYEQLGFLGRWALTWLCWRRGNGLLITAHRPQGFAPLCTTNVSGETAAAIIAELWTEGPRLDVDVLAARLAAHQGSLRELLFELYDEYEAR